MRASFLAVGDPSDAHFTQVKVAFALPSQFIFVVATDPALGPLVQLEICLTALAASIEKVCAITLPAGLFLL